LNERKCRPWRKKIGSETLFVTGITDTGTKVNYILGIISVGNHEKGLLMKVRIYLLATMLLFAGDVAAQQPEPITLAVSDLAAQGVKESEAAVISEQLRAELMKSARVRLIERSQMQEILREQGFQQSGCTSDACAVEVGQLLGVKNMVVGSVGMAGSYTVLSARIISVATGSIVVNESIRTKGGIDVVLESGIEETAGKLIAGLFPRNAPPPPAADKSNRRGPAKAILIGGGTAVLVGGGIAAAVLWNRGANEPDDEGASPNTRIDLP
jgi:TolB-like protein